MSRYLRKTLCLTTCYHSRGVRVTHALNDIDITLQTVQTYLSFIPVSFTDFQECQCGGLSVGISHFIQLK